ncbi:MAG: hypothetical protein OEU92_05795 [Alphaproteobacteria bacterium]|nr:hypothetical protein [Alphaproteobacteria bacterium]
MFEILWNLRSYAETFKASIFSPVKFYTHYYDVLQTSPSGIFSINIFEKDDHKYLPPLKFATIGVAIGGFLVWPMIKLGVATGAYHPVYHQMLEWAEQEGISGHVEFVGVDFIDKILLELVLLVIFNLLGFLLWATSGQMIPIRFAAGYFLYISAWFLASSLVHSGFIILSIFTPLFHSGLPQLTGSLFNLVIISMLVGFPIAFWPRILKIKRRTVTIAIGISMAIWLSIMTIADLLVV